MYCWTGGLGMVLCGFLLCVPGRVYSLINHSPQISVSPGDIITVKEDTPIDTVIGTLIVKDEDGDDIIFKIEDQFTKEHVKFGEQLGISKDGISVNIILIKQLDRETDTSSVTLYFKYSDGKDEFLEMTVRVLIKDVNDESPKFDNPLEIIAVNENAAIGYTVTQMIAEDLDLGDFVTYRMEATNMDYQSVFAIGSVGQVTVEASLDFESHELYKFTVFATDKENHETSTQLIIEILDFQDTPPAFLHQSYYASIQEDAMPGDPVLTVSAADGDKKINNKITYKFVEQNTSIHFAIDDKTGEITVASDLDRDEGPIKQMEGRYKLHVEAMEEVDGDYSGDVTARTVVIVEILDVNEHYPEFESKHFEAIVQENTLAKVPIIFNGALTKMILTDLDQGENSHISVTIQKDGKPYSDFSAVPPEFQSTAIIQIIVKNSAVLDYETVQTITFQVVATEINTPEKHSTSATVTLQISNITEPSYPRFSETSYVFYVEEHSVVTTTVTSMQVSLENSVTYSLHGDNERFAIDELSGEVTVNGILDREQQDKYQMFVTARDINNLKTQVELIVHITDINDHPPMFKASHYYGSMQDGEETFNRPVIVVAKDIDRPNTKNSEVRYLIENAPNNLQGVFTIDAQTGEITLNVAIVLDDLDAAFDRSITLLITAHDLGETQLSSSVDVIIDVIAVDVRAKEVSTSDYEVVQMVLIAVAVVLVLACLLLGLALCKIKQRYTSRLKTYGALPSIADSDANLRRSDMPTTNMHASGTSNPMYGQHQTSHDQHYHHDPDSLDVNALAGDRIHRFNEEQQATMNFYSDEDALTDHSGNGSNPGSISSHLQTAMDLHKRYKNEDAGGYATTGAGHEYVKGRPTYIPPVAI